MTKVLIVDDDESIRELLAESLTNAGYGVAEAEDGEFALEIAAREPINIIILDVQMPGIDGFETLRKLGESPETRDLPVILLTSVPPSDGEKLGLDLGVTHYIQKPWQSGVVEATIRVALREAGYVAAPVRVGQKILDDKLGGGIPTSSLTLIEGASSSGKSVLCQHLIHGALRDGHNIAHLSSEHTTRGLISQMDSIGLRVASDLRSGKLLVQALRQPVEDETRGASLFALVQDIQDLPQRYRVVFVDAITNLASSSPDYAVIEFFSACKRLSVAGKTIVLVAHSFTFDEKLLVRLRSLCDGYLSLHVQNTGAKLMNTLEVRKVHSAEQPTGSIINFDVEPGFGIHIIPMQQARV
jgi:archaellum biogenesis ATPase FlaH/ActR/RegA family two-component response regulator